MRADYSNVPFPLNAFLHVLTREEGRVDYLHYGIFQDREESIARAQEHSTELLFARLPPPPARVLDVGIGLGTTLDRLARAGYDAEGVTPDENQIALARARHGGDLRVRCAPFEAIEGGSYDLLLFQESSQYIDSEALFERARQLAPRVLVLDEFALKPVDRPDALHSLAGFQAAARAHGFAVTDELDLSEKAAPTIEYFLDRIPRHRDALIGDLGLTERQIDDLLASGESYRDLYRNGSYGYRLLQLTRREE